MNERERFWIQHFNSFHNGYNLDKGGDGVSGYTHTPSEISKMRRIQNPLVVLQFDLDHNFVYRFEGGISHAAKQLHYTRECIKRCCEHSGGKISYKNYYWIFEKEYNSESFSWEKYESGAKIIDLPKKSPKIVRKICQYDKNRQLIKIWNSFSELENAGFNRAQVNCICNKRKGKKTHKNYIWAYDDYDFSDGYFDSLDNYFNKAIEARKRKVFQYSKVGTIIRKFDSIADAINSLKIGHDTLTKVITEHLIIFDTLLTYSDNNWVVSEEVDLKTCERLNSNKNNARKIVRYDDDGNEKCFPSISSAAHEMRLPIGSIHRAITKNHSYKGYTWKISKIKVTKVTEWTTEPTALQWLDTL